MLGNLKIKIKYKMWEKIGGVGIREKVFYILILDRVEDEYR